jgi:hypothetical protein
MTLATVAPSVHAIVPLTILEAMQHVDAPVEDGLDEFHSELAVKRFGMSETVAAQIDRYRRLADRNRRVELAEVTALFRLVGRRSDAGLVFADAGRLAGRRAMNGLGGPAGFALRGIPGFARRGLGFAIARSAARIFDVVLAREGDLISGSMPEAPSASSTPGGVGCGFYGSAIAEILRGATDFDGAMFHVRCHSRGDGVCKWISREGEKAA